MRSLSAAASSSASTTTIQIPRNIAIPRSPTRQQIVTGVPPVPYTSEVPQAMNWDQAVQELFCTQSTDTAIKNRRHWLNFFLSQKSTRESIEEHWKPHSQNKYIKLPELYDWAFKPHNLLLLNDDAKCNLICHKDNSHWDEEVLIYFLELRQKKQRNEQEEKISLPEDVWISLIMPMNEERGESEINWRFYNRILRLAKKHRCAFSFLLTHSHISVVSDLNDLIASADYRNYDSRLNGNGSVKDYIEFLNTLPSRNRALYLQSKHPKNAEVWNQNAVFLRPLNCDEFLFLDFKNLIEPIIRNKNFHQINRILACFLNNFMLSIESLLDKLDNPDRHYYFDENFLSSLCEISETFEKIILYARIMAHVKAQPQYCNNIAQFIGRHEFVITNEGAITDIDPSLTEIAYTVLTSSANNHKENQHYHLAALDFLHALHFSLSENLLKETITFIKDHNLSTLHERMLQKITLYLDEIYANITGTSSGIYHEPFIDVNNVIEILTKFEPILDFIKFVVDSNLPNFTGNTILFARLYALTNYFLTNIPFELITHKHRSAFFKLWQTIRSLLTDQNQYGQALIFHIYFSPTDNFKEPLTYDEIKVAIKKVEEISSVEPETIRAQFKTTFITLLKHSYPTFDNPIQKIEALLYVARFNPEESIAPQARIYLNEFFEKITEIATSDAVENLRLLFDIIKLLGNTANDTAQAFPYLYKMTLRLSYYDLNHDFNNVFRIAWETSYDLLQEPQKTQALVFCICFSNTHMLSTEQLINFNFLNTVTKEFCRIASTNPNLKSYYYYREKFFELWKNAYPTFETHEQKISALIYFLCFDQSYLLQKEQIDYFFATLNSPSNEATIIHKKLRLLLFYCFEGLLGEILTKRFRLSSEEASVQQFLTHLPITLSNLVQFINQFSENFPLSNNNYTPHNLLTDILMHTQKIPRETVRFILSPEEEKLCQISSKPILLECCMQGKLFDFVKSIAKKHPDVIDLKVLSNALRDSIINGSDEEINHLLDILQICLTNKNILGDESAVASKCSSAAACGSEAAFSEGNASLTSEAQPAHAAIAPITLTRTITNDERDHLNKIIRSWASSIKCMQFATSINTLWRLLTPDSDQSLIDVTNADQSLQQIIRAVTLFKDIYDKKLTPGSKSNLPDKKNSEGPYSFLLAIFNHGTHKSSAMLENGKRTREVLEELGWVHDGEIAAYAPITQSELENFRKPKSTGVNECNATLFAGSNGCHAAMFDNSPVRNDANNLAHKK